MKSSGNEIFREETSLGVPPSLRTPGITRRGKKDANDKEKNEGGNYRIRIKK